MRGERGDGAGSGFVCEVRRKRWLLASGGVFG